MDGGGQSGEEGDDVGDCGPPSTGWLHREEEEDEAVRRDTSGELDAAQDGGDWCGKAAAARARLGFHGGERKREQGKERGQRRARLGGDLLYHDAGEGGRHRGRARGHGGMVAAVSPLSPQGRREFCENPLANFKSYCKLVQQRFSEFN